MKTPIFDKSVYGLTYYGSSINPEYFVSHDDINQTTDSGITGKVNSLHVHHLSKVSLQFPERVYHLAATIQKRSPHVAWNWEKQLFDLESEIRDLKYEGQYFEKTGYLKMSHFDSDHSAMSWQYHLDLFLEGKESSSLLGQKVRKRIAYFLR